MKADVTLFLILVFHTFSASRADGFCDDDDEFERCWWKISLLSLGCATFVTLSIILMCVCLPCCTYAKRKRRAREARAQLYSNTNLGGPAPPATNPVYYVETGRPQYSHMYYAQQPRGRANSSDSDNSDVHPNAAPPVYTVYLPSQTTYPQQVSVSHQVAYPQQVQYQHPPAYNPQYPPPPTYSTNPSTPVPPGRQNYSREDPYLPAYNSKY